MTKINKSREKKVDALYVAQKTFRSIRDTILHLESQNDDLGVKFGMPEWIEVDGQVFLTKDLIEDEHLF